MRRCLLRFIVGLTFTHGNTPSATVTRPTARYITGRSITSGMRDTQDAEDKERLLARARVVMRRLTDTPFHERNFSLYGAVHGFEAKLIGQALDESGGSITKAARLLGVTHQSLISMLDTRHKALAAKRKPSQKRRRSIIKKPKE